MYFKRKSNSFKKYKLFRLVRLDCQVMNAFKTILVKCTPKIKLKAKVFVSKVI